jgi:hypothetical protein
MIKKNVQPEVWPVPAWHPDFGDASAELEHLRSFAMVLLAIVPDAHVELEAPEPGLMNLAVELPDGSSAEVYSISSGNPPSERRYGLFLAPGTPNEREIYEDAIENAMNCLTGSTLGDQ